MEYITNIFKSKNIETHIPLNKRRAIDDYSGDVDGLKELVLEPTDDEKFERKRLVQNSRYFEKRYRDLREIMKVIMIASIIFAILTIMSTRGFLPRVFGTTIIPILVGLFIFYLVYRYFDVAMRNQINYDDYDFDIPDYKNRANQ
mgnify:CR=1 FL=1